MNYLLDTCVVSQFPKKLPSHVVEWFEMQDEDNLFLSVVTVAEIADGIGRLKASKKKALLEDFLTKLLDRFNSRILSINNHVALEWGYLNSNLRRKGRSVGVQDLYIASTARHHSMSVVTLNERHFSPLDIRVVNPWKFKD